MCVTATWVSVSWSVDELSVNLLCLCLQYIFRSSFVNCQWMCCVCLCSIYSGHHSLLIPPAEVEQNPALWLTTVSQYRGQLWNVDYIVGNIAMTCIYVTCCSSFVKRNLKTEADMTVWPFLSTSPPLYDAASIIWGSSVQSASRWPQKQLRL